MRPAAALLALVACDTTLHMRVFPAEDEDIALEAAEILGVPATLTDDEVGAATVVMFRLCDTRMAGLGDLSERGCTAWVVADDDPLLLAHEMGHALGLEHVDDEDNLMHSCVDPGATLTDAQQYMMHRELMWLAFCR